jgi:type I restriction enzyme S subunit
MTRWPSAPIRRLARLGTGHTPSRTRPEYWVDCDIPWFTLADVGQLRDGVTTSVSRTTEMISALGVANSSAEVHPAGTVILSRTASVGFSAILEREMATSQDFATWTCGPQLLPRFLLYSLRGQPQQIEARKTGSTHKTIYMPDLETLRTPMPPVIIQRAIADFLDAETTRIDALIEKKRRMVEIAGARVWEAFMRRLYDLNAPMVPIRRGLAFITDGPFGSAFSSSDYSDNGAAVVRLGNIGFAKYRPQDQVFLPMEMYQNFQRCWVRPGDVLIAGLGDDNNHAGRACLAPDLGPALVKGKCFCARVRGDITDAGFLVHLLSSPLGAELVGLSARGSTRSMINLEVIKETAIPMPTVQAQRVLAERTVKERQRTDGLIDTLMSQLYLLAEHRQALITAAVTGDLDIPGVAA